VKVVRKGADVTVRPDPRTETRVKVLRLILLADKKLAKAGVASCTYIFLQKEFRMKKRITMFIATKLLPRFFNCTLIRKGNRDSILLCFKLEEK
jgi:hypothetical protein